MAEPDEPDALALFGTFEPAAERRTLRAGPLSMVLEAGQVREVRWHGVEVLRGIAWLVRDGGWGTPPLALEDLAVEEGGEALAVTWRFALDAPLGALTAAARVEGRAEGQSRATLRFEVEAAVSREVTTSRTGFCVLHPDGAAGLPLEVTHTDGTVEATAFPQLIRQDQPALDVRALRHAPAPGVAASVTFEGGTWEMEDQRNWADASFKTYVRPVAWPRPYVLPAGSVDRQVVTLTVEGTPAPAPARAAPRPATAPVVPDLWLRLDEREAVPGALPLPGLAHGLILRVDGPAPEPARLAAAEALAAREGMALAVEAILPLRDAEAEAAALLAALAGRPVATLLVAGARDRRTRPPGRDPEGEAPLSAALAALRQGFAGPVGAGTPAFFTEFNRNPPPAASPNGADFAFFGGSAIVHAADDASVMETPGVLPAILGSAAALVPGTPLWPGPLAIAPSLAPYAPALAPSDGRARTCMAARDPRHGALFGAAHLVAVMAALAGRVLAAAPLMASGPCGLSGPDGAALPLAFVHAALASARGAPLASSAAQGEVAVLGWDGAEPGVLLANLRPDPVRFEPPAAPGRLHRLQPGARGWARATPRDRLAPFGTYWWRPPRAPGL